MRVNRRLSDVGLWILLFAMAWVFAAGVTVSHAQNTEMCEEEAEAMPYESSEVWASESEEEYQENGFEENAYQEGFQEEMPYEEEGDYGYENAPTEEGPDPYMEQPSETEDLYMTPDEDDDLAHAPRRDE
jgi:hypothetical protein